MARTFATSSACFATSFITQPNGPKCVQLVRNTPKHQFRVQWGGSGAFVAKNSGATSWHELLDQFVPVRTEFHNATKWSQMHPNSLKRTKNISLGSTGMDRVCSLRKSPLPLRGTNFCTSSACFAPSFIRKPNTPECTQIVRTHQNVIIGSNGVDRERSLRNVRCDFVARTFALVRPVLHRVS